METRSPFVFRCERSLNNMNKKKKKRETERERERE